MNLRLFIAIAVPAEIKSGIRELLGEIQPLFRDQSDIRWVTEENWHFTVSFLGYEPAEKLPAIEQSLTALLPFREPEKGLKINFEKFVYGPNDRPGNQRRMVWLTATRETSKKIN